MLAIKNNIMAGNAARHLGKAYDSLSSSVERLASGLRINGAKDDAAGLAVRELIRADIAVLNQGSRNAQDGISMLQTMEGAMGVIDDNLIRMKELAEQAATGSYSDEQRAIMNAEFDEMADEIDRIAGATKFNDIAMLNSATGSISIHVGTDSTIDINKVDMSKVGLGINTGVDAGTITFDGTLTDTEDSFLVTSDEVDLVLEFDDGTTSEKAINVNFTAGDYTMEQVKSKINEVSQALDFDTDGTDLSYDAATIVEDETAGTFSLQLASRGTGDATPATFTVEATEAGGTFVAGGNTTNLLAAAANVDAGSWTGGTVDGGVNIATASAAAAALDTVTTAINTKDTARAAFGYKMNRLESTIAILDIQAENLSVAESRISDVDVATEMAAMTRTQVLSQAGISMLSQANQMPQMALSLLQ